MELPCEIHFLSFGNKTDLDPTDIDFCYDKLLSFVNKTLHSVLELLGAGGQGEVCLADCEGERCALKVYIDEQHPDFLYNLRNNIEKGSLSRTFLWPRALAEDEKCAGYVMDLRPKNYVSFVSYLTGKNMQKFDEKC